MSTPSPVPPGPSGPAVSRLALPILLLAVFIVPLSVAGAATALPDIADHLGSDPTRLQWVVNGFNASFALFTLVWGGVSDRIGYKQTFVLGTALHLVACLISALAPSLLVLDLARILAGASGAAIGTSVTSLIAGAYTGQQRARAFGLFGTVLGTGLAVGPTVAGLLTETAGWRGVFVAFAVVVGLSLAGSVVVPGIRHERQPGQRLLDPALLRNRRFVALIIVPAIQAFGYIALLTYLPVALSAVYGLSSGATGLFMVAMTGPVLVGPMIGSRLVHGAGRSSLHTLIYASITLMLLGNLGMLLLAAQAPLWTLVPPMLLLGFSFGLPLGVLDGAAMESVPLHASGSAAGILNFLRLGSEAVVVGVYGVVLAALISSRIADPGLAEDVAAGRPGHASAYIHAFVLGQGALLLAVLLGLLATLVLHRAGGHRSVVHAPSPSAAPTTESTTEHLTESEKETTHVPGL